MKLHAPFIISARLLPALKLGDLIISMEMLSRESDGRNRYRYFIDPPAGCRAKPLEASDLLAALEEASLAIRAAGKRLADSGVAPDAEWQAFRKARAAIARATGNADT